MWDAAAIIVVSHTESSATGQGVYDLPKEAAHQSIHPKTLPYQALLPLGKHLETMTVVWVLGLSKNQAGWANKQFYNREIRNNLLQAKP